MFRTKKRAIATFAAVGTAAVLGIGGFAIAAFVQDAESDAIAAQAEVFQQLVVTGAPDDATLWPGQSTDVTLTVDNAANDTDIVVTGAIHVAPQNVDVTTVNPADQAYCRTKLVLADYTGIPAAEGQIAAGGSRAIVVQNGLTLDATADNRCQNMTFTVKWAVTANTAYSG